MSTKTPRSSRTVLCAVQEGADVREGVLGAGKAAIAAAALAAVVSFGAVEDAKADIAGLTPCSESKQYARRQKKEISGLTKRLAKVKQLNFHFYSFVNSMRKEVHQLSRCKPLLIKPTRGLNFMLRTTSFVERMDCLISSLIQATHSSMDISVKSW